MRFSIERFAIALLFISTTALMLAACDPAPPTDTTTSTSSSSTSSIPAGESQTRALQADLDDGTLVIDSVVVSDDTLYPPEGSTITFEGDGKLYRSDGASGRPAFNVETSNVTINNLHVVGTDACLNTNTLPYNPDTIGETYASWDSNGLKEHEHALEVSEGASNVRVFGLKAENIWGDGLYIGGGKDIQVMDIDVRCAGRSGISNVGGTDVLVDGGSISGVFWWIIDVEPFGNRTVKNFTVQNVEIGFSRWYWFNAKGPDFNCQVENVNVINNTFLPTYNRPLTWRGDNPWDMVNGCTFGEIVYY